MTKYKKNGEPTAKYLNYMRKKAELWVDSEITDLYQSYANPSQTKIDAYNNHKKQAHIIRILSYNVYGFTVAYMKNNDTIFVVATPYETHEIEKRCLI